MKKKFLLILIVNICPLLFGKTVLESEKHCEYFESFVGSEWSEYKSTLSSDELYKDIDTLCYYLENAYADFDAMYERGFRNNEFKKYFFSIYSKQEKIDTRNLFRDISEYLKPFVVDRHFSLITKTAFYEPLKSSTFFYTNTFVEKTHNGFFIYQTDNDNLSIGMKYEDSEEYLFLYPAKGKSVYRIGTIGLEKKDTLPVTFNQKIFCLPLFDDGAIQLSTIKYHELESEKSIYISLSSFLLPEKNSPMRRGADIVLSKYANLASKYYDKKNIIIDLRGNLGGHGIYSEYLLFSLYTNNKKDFSCDNLSKFKKWNETYIKNEKWIESPVTLEALYKVDVRLGFSDAELKKYLRKERMNSKRRVYKTVGIFPLKKNKKSFTGKVIILTDRNSLSASENTVLLAKKLFGDNAVIIGEKTGGCNEFWDNLDYMLPVSKVLVHFGSRKKLNLADCASWHGEGVGIYPDYWAIGEDLNDTVFWVTGDEEMKKLLVGIDSRLM